MKRPADTPFEPIRLRSPGVVSTTADGDGRQEPVEGRRIRLLDEVALLGQYSSGEIHRSRTGRVDA
jgi:hypothetical protein